MSEFNEINSSLQSCAADQASGNGEPTSHAPPDDLTGAERQRLEGELEEILYSFTTVRSELEMTRLLPQAKRLYEQLHPEVKHGGCRRKKQDDNLSAWPCFAQHVAETRGVDKRTVYRRLADAEKLTTLDEEAERSCYGTALANRLAVLTRIAAIPSPKLQKDLVTLFDRRRNHAAAELIKYEEAWGIRPPPAPPKDLEMEDETLGSDDDQAPAGTPDAAAEANANGDQPPTDHVNEGGLDLTPEQHAGLTSIMTALRVATVADCLLAIQQLQAKEAEIECLRGQLLRSEAENARLKGELAAYEGAPLSRPVAPVGAKVVNDTLGKEHALEAPSSNVLEAAGTPAAHRPDDMRRLAPTRVEHDDRSRDSKPPTNMGNDTAGSEMVTEAEFARRLALPPRNASALRALDGCPARQVSRFWYWPLEQGLAWYWQTKNGRAREAKELDKISEIADLIPCCARDEDGTRDDFDASQYGEPSLYAGQKLLASAAPKA